MLLAKNTRIPATVTKYFELDQPDQKFVNIKVKLYTDGILHYVEEGVEEVSELSMQRMVHLGHEPLQVFEGESAVASDNYQLASLVFPVGGQAIAVDKEEPPGDEDDGRQIQGEEHEGP